MNNDKQTLVRLQQLGLIDANARVNSNQAQNNAEKYHSDTPWFLHLFFGFSGVLASLFFIGFLTLALVESDLLDSAIGLFMVGCLLSVAGLVLFYNKKTRQNTFMSSLAFTFSVTGQLYFIWALFTGEMAHPLPIWLLLLLQIIMTIMPNIIYRLLTTSIALGCVVYLLSFYNIPEASLGLLALLTIIANLQRYPLLQRVPANWRIAAFDISTALAYASAIMLLLVSVYFIAAEYGRDFVASGERFYYNYYLAQSLLTLASLYGAYLLLKRYQIKILSKAGLFICCAIVILGIISVYVSGLLATSLIIIIATANSQRVLLGLGIISLISYIFWYYYQLDTSLLIKAASMLVVGIVMLAARAAKRIGYDAAY
jgi:hypothetical protein